MLLCFSLKNSDDSGEDDVGKDLQSVEKEPLVSADLKLNMKDSVQQLLKL